MPVDDQKPGSPDRAAGQGPGWQWDRRYAEHPWTTETDPLLVELAADLVPGAAIDLGCGTGRNALWLARRGWQVTGVDASAVGLAQARERARTEGLELELVQADLLEYRPPAGRFDLAVLANIHLRPGDLDHVLARAVEAIAPGGRLFVVGHHADSHGHHGPPDLARLFTEERLAAALPSGLVVERLERRERDSGSSLDGKPDVSVLVWATVPGAPRSG